MGVPGEKTWQGGEDSEQANQGAGEIRSPEAEDTSESLDDRQAEVDPGEDKAKNSPFQSRGSMTISGSSQNNIDEKPDKSVEQLNYSEITPDESRDILMRTEITRDEHSEIYDSTALDRYGLGPKYMVNIDDTKVGVSEIFFGRGESGKGARPHAMIYVENGEGRFAARNFYKSNSQNSWRLLPGMESNRGEARGNHHYYKSPYGEQAINAPVELQKTLDELYTNNLRRTEEKDNTENFDALLDEVFALPPEFDNHPQKSRPSDKPPLHIGAFWGDDQINNFDRAFRSEIGERPWMGYEEKYSGNRLTSPKDLVLDSDNSPDLSKELMSWQDAEGNTKRVFASKDGKMKYEFLTDEKGRSCLALVECANAGISSFGLRSQFVQTGDFTTPLYEYEGQTKGRGVDYGDLDDAHYPYYGMWRKYLSQAPFIREYTDYLRDQGVQVADLDDLVGRAEADRIYEIGCKIQDNEPLSKAELEFICQPEERFSYPESASSDLFYIKRHLRLGELFNAGLDLETIASVKHLNENNFEDFLRYGADPERIIDMLSWQAPAYFDVFLKYNESLDASQLYLDCDSLKNRDVEDQRKVVAALLDHGIDPENLSLDDYPECTLELVEILRAHDVSVDINSLTSDILDQIWYDMGDYDDNINIITEIAHEFSRLAEIGADKDRLAREALEVFQAIDHYRQEDES
ncbi:MAG: hypothetical protein Q4F56_03175 [Candidatus Saccharibacteria bacterium]|nr:hypothetical protein [Candidatus Saccharibacteria bacterium]